MSCVAVVLIVIAALIHACWNLIGKRQKPSAAFFLVAATFGALPFLPLLVYYRGALPLIPAPVWALLAATGFFLALYYAALAGAYHAGDLSLAYPLARSSPILVVTFVTFALGKGREIGPVCLLGIALVVGGCLFVPMKRFGEFRLRNYLNACCLLAFLAAFGTAGYSIADDEALRRLRTLPGTPLGRTEWTLVYAALEAASSIAWQTAYVLCVPRERRCLSEVLRTSKARAVVVGAAVYVAYTLVLASMAFVANISYVVAFRQLSIPIGAFLGMTVLEEPRPVPKLVGVAAVFLGVVLVGIG